MPPKKGGKAKKEEVIEIPKPHLLPDGPKSYFVGGWSKFQTLTDLAAICKSDQLTENVYVLVPGTEEKPGMGAQVPEPEQQQQQQSTTQEGAEGTADATAAVAPADEEEKKPVVDEKEAVARLRPVKIVGLLPSLKKEPVAAKAEGEDGEEIGEPEPAAEEEEGEAKPVTAGEKVLLADRSIVIKGDIRFEAAPEPVVAAPPPEEEKKDEKPVKKGKKGAVVKEDPAEVAAREAAAAAAREAAERAKEKGAAPSRWPEVQISNLYFDGAVTVKGIHINFVNCHFAGAVNTQLSVHQYCKVTLTKCSFAAPQKAGLYCFQKSDVTVTDCIFAGEVLPQNEEEAVQAKAASAGTSEIPSAVDNVNNVGLFVDDAKVVAIDCLFENVATAVLFNDRCEDSSLSQCAIRRCRNTGVFSNGTAAAIKDCNVSQCGYYSLRFEGRCKGKVLKNTVAGAPVKVGEGAHPFLHSNNLSSRLLDGNEKGTISLEPKY